MQSRLAILKMQRSAPASHSDSKMHIPGPGLDLPIQTGQQWSVVCVFTSLCGALLHTRIRTLLMRTPILRAPSWNPLGACDGAEHHRVSHPNLANTHTGTRSPGDFYLSIIITYELILYIDYILYYILIFIYYYIIHLFLCTCRIF